MIARPPLVADTPAAGPTGSAAARARDLRVAGQGEAAISLCLEGLAVDPDDGAVFLVLGQCLGDAGEWAGAAEAARRAGGLLASDPAPRLLLADALAHLDDPAGAAIAIDQAWRLAPGDAAVDRRRRQMMATLIRHIRGGGDAVGIGQSLFQAGAFMDAAVMFSAQAAARADDIAALCMQALSLCRGGAPHQAVPAAAKAATVAPRLAKAQAIHGLALSQTGQHQAAIAAYGRALALKPDDDRTRLNLALVQLLVGDFAAGWVNYQARPDRRPQALPMPRWRGEPLAGRSVLVHAEQGYGDTIQFVRLVPRLEAMGARVVLEVPGPLRRLIDGFACAARRITYGDPIPACDFHVPLLSLPGLLGLTSLAGDGPYLPAPPLPAGWAPPAGRAIGVVWSGNPENKADIDRSIAAAHLLPALSAAVAGTDSRLVSLQKDVRDGDRSTVAALVAADRLCDAAPVLGDFADTAAVIMAMDLVIAVDTAVAHLAGALGRPCWLLLPHVPDWRWGMTGADCPIYPRMRLFRQIRGGDWSGVIGAVAAALAGMHGAPPGR